MPITARNYAAHLERFLRDQVTYFRNSEVRPGAHLTEENRRDIVANLEAMNQSVRQSQHFALPDNGELTSSKDLCGLRGLILKLPYRKITLEFRMEDGTCVVICAQESLSKPGHIEIMHAHSVNMTVWGINPYVVHISEHWEEGSILAEGEPALVKATMAGLKGFLELTKASLKIHQEDETRQLDLLQKEARETDLTVINFCEALACSNVCTRILEPVDPAVNRKRVAKGKLPLYETKVLVVKIPKQIKKKAPPVGTHASPREHLRRRHIRVYHRGEPNEIRVYVSQHIVNPGGPGRIDKTYAIIGVDD